MEIEHITNGRVVWLVLVCNLLLRNSIRKISCSISGIEAFWKKATHLRSDPNGSGAFAPEL